MSEPAKVMGTFGNPYTHRVEAALRLKGVPYELVLEHTDIKNLEYNLVNKKEPVLVHGGRSITGSHTIVEYVDEAFDHGPPLMPADPYDRATARFWAHFIDDKLSKMVWLALWTEGEVQEASLREAKRNLGFVEEQLRGKRFFGGDAVGFLDVAACGLTTCWLGVLEEVAGVSLVDDVEYPDLCRWAREYAADEVVKQRLPDRDQLLAYYTAKRDKFLFMARSMLQK